jgi:hypothetical protein
VALMQRRNVTLTRGQLGQFGSFVGGFSLLLGLLGAIWQGDITVAVMGLVAVGIAGLALWHMMTPQDVKAFLQGRQTRYSTIAFFSTLLLIGIVSLVYILVQREAIVADQTIDRRFSLNKSTLDILEQIKRVPNRIEITAFYDSQSVLQREIDDQYFQLYESATDGRIYRRFVNPVEDPAFTAGYIDALEQGIHVFASYVDDEGRIIQGTTIPIELTNRQEYEISQGLRQLLAAGRFKVYFEIGANEADPVANTQQGLSLINGYLRTNGIVTEPLNLANIAASQGQIPADASAIIIVQPRRDFIPAEVAVLDAYLKRGGALFIAADIFNDSTSLFLGAENSPFNDYLWQNFGLRMTNQIVVDPDSSGQTALDVIGAAIYANNAIGANLNVEGDLNTATQFRIARAIEVNPEPPVTNGNVVMTTPAAWGETNWDAVFSRSEYVYDEGTDAPGALSLVAWARNEQTNAKIVLVGDADFMTNGMVSSPAGNTILVLDAIGWMTGYSEEVSFEPKPFLTVPVMFVGGPMLDQIALFTLIIMPGAMLLMAAFVYIRRTRR